jgi:hypothetical protein
LVASWAKKLGFRSESVWQKDFKLWAHVLVRDDLVVLAVPGTSNAKHVLLDAQMRLTKTGDGAEDTHLGFAQATGKLWPELRSALIRAREEDPNRPCEFTGHSLGAAVTQLAGLAWQDGGGQVLGLHAFGTPKLGGATFASRFEQALGDRTYAYVNGRDIITRNPPGFTGFTGHCSNVRTLREAGQPVQSTSLPDIQVPPGVDRERFNTELAAAVVFAAERSNDVLMSPPPRGLLSLVGLGDLGKMIDDHRLTHYQQKLNVQALGEIAGTMSST